MDITIIFSALLGVYFSIFLQTNFRFEKKALDIIKRIKKKIYEQRKIITFSQSLTQIFFIILLGGSNLAVFKLFKQYLIT